MKFVPRLTISGVWKIWFSELEFSVSFPWSTRNNDIAVLKHGLYIGLFSHRLVISWIQSCNSLERKMPKATNTKQLLTWLIEFVCIRHKKDEILPQQEMKAKKKNILNRTFVKDGYRMLVHWKCDICESVFGTFRQMKAHKIETHTH